MQKQVLWDLDRIRGPVSLLGQGGGGEEWLSSSFSNQRFRIETDEMWEARAGEQSGIDFKILGLNNWQNEWHLLR